MSGLQTHIFLRFLFATDVLGETLLVVYDIPCHIQFQLDLNLAQVDGHKNVRKV